MSESKDSLKKCYRVFLLAIVFAVVIYLVVQNIGVFGNVLLIMVGFGAVILVHEFGHFIIAKLCDIKVEAFSIGFPPILAGIRRTQQGVRIRILPALFRKGDDQCDDEGLSFTVGGKEGRAGETEYRIGLVPFGGFVKMLGQDDIGPNKTSDDPRSYANKPVGTRAAVITAGVVFNVISAVVVFMLVFLVGVKLMPAVAGGIVPNSPAAQAGLEAGDEIIEIAGKSDNLDFSNIMIAAALSDVNEAVPLKVRHIDGTVEDFAIASKKLRGQEMRVFGIVPPQTLTVAKVSDPNALLAQTGLLPGDRIKAVNGREVNTHWEMENIVEEVFAPTVTITAERTVGPGQNELIESKIKLDLRAANKEVKSESDLSHIYTMVPRLRITAVVPKPPSVKDKLLCLLNKIGIGKTVTDTGPSLQSGDIILSFGDVANPTYNQMRDITTECENKELAVKILRADPDGEKSLTVTVVPRRAAGSKRVVIGVVVALDAEHPVVARTVDAEGGMPALAIPRGASVTAVDGVGVSNFYDIAGQIRKNAGQRISIDYRVNERIAGDVALNVPAAENFVAVKTVFADFIPFEDLKRLYKAGGPIDAVGMGYKKTISFIVQTYVTLRRLLAGLVSPKQLMGPVGIVTISYKIVAEQPLVYYIYFLGLISACIAVFNFLPLPPLDGGLVVLLLVEKVKGSALSESAQTVIAYAGWALIGTLFLYVTFNDIVRSFFG